MEEKSFTWIPFYTELAEALLQFKEDRKPLVDWIYSVLCKVGSKSLVSYLKQKDGTRIVDIDPFSVFAIFNRSLKADNRIEILRKFKEKMSIQAEVPSDFNGIPTIFAMKAFFFSWEEDNDKVIHDLWHLFEDAVLEKDISKSFDQVLTNKIPKNSLTMALYWVRPYKYLALDQNNRNFLNSFGIKTDRLDFSFSVYNEILQDANKMLSEGSIPCKTYPEFSYEAWKASQKMTIKDSNPKDMKDRIDEYIELLDANHNLILTGAPGTGKTHLAKEIAKGMGCSENEIKFVQFHPSYDYTDFVEGLIPNEKGGFELRDGIFKKFCANAIEKYETNDFDAVFDELKLSIGETLLKLKTTQGADFGVSVNSRGNLKLHTGAELKEQGVLTRNSLKAQFAGLYVNNYWRGYYEGVISYLKEKYGLKQTENDPKKKYVFVIDEINRGEISKIFGELFFSIDPGYRGTEGDTRTQYANMVDEPNVFDIVLGAKDYGHFFVPKNVYIIGTMNDIDRSVENMDFAMRRRFAWREITAKESQAMLDNIDELIGAPLDEIKARMDNLNAAIVGEYKYKEGKEEKKIPGLGQSFQIGAAYFTKYAKYMDRDKPFEYLWEYHLKGLLAEYLRGNVDAEKELEMLKEAYNDSNNGQQLGKTKPEGTGEGSSASV